MDLTKVALARQPMRVLIGLLVLVIVGGCSGGGGNQADDAKPEKNIAVGPNFDRDIQPIFDTNCVTCHQAAGASGGLNLESGTAYKSIVSVKSGESPLVYIAAGKPENSYLVRKLEGTHIQAGGSGERMPLTGPLDSKSLAVIREWVKAGAKKD